MQRKDVEEINSVEQEVAIHFLFWTKNKCVKQQNRRCRTNFVPTLQFQREILSILLFYSIILVKTTFM